MEGAFHSLDLPQRESFYINREGSSILEILLVTFSCLFSSFLCALLGLGRRSKGNPLNLCEVIVFCLFAVFSVIFSEALLSVYALILLAALKNLSFAKKPPSLHSRIAVARGTITLLTSVCILAVDFPCFPRRFAKTTGKGLSLMDTGISFAIFSMGLSFKKKSVSFVRRLARLSKEAALLCLVGAVALCVAPPKGYGEYGKNMNFFFVLAMVKVLVFCLHPLLDFPELLGYLLLVLNHIFLYFFSLEEYAFSPSRGMFHTDNKEGFVMVGGCLTLFLLSNGVRRAMEAEGCHARLLLRLFLSLVLFALVKDTFQPARIVFNTSFCLFGYSLGLLHVFVIVCFENIFYPVSFLQAVSEKQVWFFLTADVLTGCIGKTVDTVRTNRSMSIAILLSYLFCVSILCFIVFPRIQKKIMSFV